MKLAIEGERGTLVHYEVDKEVISIGASSSNDIVLRTPGVGPVHVTIQRNGPTFTFLAQKRQVVIVNGERRSRGVLRVGDRFRIGSANLVFQGDDSEDIAITDVRDSDESQPEQTAGSEELQANGKSELVLYSEPHRLAEARTLLVESFSTGISSNITKNLKKVFEEIFPQRHSMLAKVNDHGTFEPIISSWSDRVPRLPARSFEELAKGSRYALLRMGSRRFLIYPVINSQIVPRAYFLLETTEDQQDDDELILAELARILAMNWERVQSLSSLYGPWESRIRTTLDLMLPGSSSAIGLLRESLISAFRCEHPILLCGRPGSGRFFAAGLLARHNPSGPLKIHAVEVQEGQDQDLRDELFGPGNTLLNPAERFRGQALVLRNIHKAGLQVQRELTAAILADLESGWGAKVRWIATTGENPLSLIDEKKLDPTFYDLFTRHIIRVPSLKHRREDLPLLTIRLLDKVAADQNKEIRGIELESLNSLLNHPFEGEIAELLRELSRLVASTPNGEIVSGFIPAFADSSEAGSFRETANTGASLLGMDDLKVVIPAIERMIIDRVLRKTKGNQSKSARVLNLSRGALIAKIKDYEIPDYRYLRKN